jgi:hypothetical protein
MPHDAFKKVTTPKAPTSQARTRRFSPANPKWAGEEAPEGRLKGGSNVCSRRRLGLRHNLTSPAPLPPPNGHREGDSHEGRR